MPDSISEQDKLLIFSYSKNLCDEAESTYVESLIENNKNAFDYLQETKETNNLHENYINELFNSQAVKKARSNLDELINEKPTLRFGFFKNLLSKNFLGYATAFSFIFVSGFYSNEFLNMSSPYKNNLLSDFDNENILEQQLTVLRTNSQTEEKEIIKKFILNMIKEKKSSGRIKIGSDSSIVFLTSSFKDDAANGYNCYTGYVRSDDKKDFVLCSAEEDSTLLFVD